MNRIFFKSRNYIPAIVLCITFLFANCTKNKKTIIDKNVKSEIITKSAKNEIRFIGQWYDRGKREELLKDFLREYRFKNQDVNIIMKFPEEIYLSGENQMKDEEFIANIIQEKDPKWDIIRLNNKYGEVAEIMGDSAWPRKYLVDFSKYPEFIKNTSPSLINNKTKNWDGIIPGPIIEGQYWALWNNSEVAKKVGINIKHIGMTTDDFLEYIKAVDKYNKNNPNDKVIAIQDGNDWETLFLLVNHLFVSELNNTEELQNQGITQNKIKVWEKVLRYMEALSQYSPVAEGKDRKGWQESSQDLLHGKALFYINGSWMYNIYEMENSVKYKNCFPNELPVFKNIDTYPGSYLSMWGVLKNSPNKEEAIKFLLAMNKPDVGDMWIKYTKCPTGIKSTLEGAAIGTDKNEILAHHIQNKYGNNLYGYRENINNSYVLGTEIWCPYFSKAVLSGDFTASVAMEKIYEKMGTK